MKYCYIVPKNDELYHHGVKGMHWGIRRYQNANGTLTSEGKAKLAKYKKKQVTRVSESYATAKNNMNSQIAFLKKKIDKKTKKGKNTKNLNEKLLKYQNKSKQLNAEAKAAIAKAKNMKLSDIDNAKRQVAAKFIKRAFAAGITGAAGGAIGGATAIAAGTAVKSAATAGALGASMGYTNSIGAGFKPSFTNLTRKERKQAVSKVKLSTKPSNVTKKPSQTMNVQRDSLGRVTSVGGSIEIGPNGKVGMYDSNGQFRSLSEIHSGLASGEYNKKKRK